LAGIVSLKASIEAWNQVDALLCQVLQTYASTLGHVEEHVARQASERYGFQGLDFSALRASLTRSRDTAVDALPTLEAVSGEVEAELRAFGKRLCENACSSDDLRDVAETLEHAIEGILKSSDKNADAMRSAAGRLRTASDSDNIAALRILVRYQSTELARLADESCRESREIASSLRKQLAELSAGLRVARREAREDTLTGLLNRRALEESMAGFQDKETPRCLILIDLDLFKSINDRFGYLAGDELLRQVAERIRSALQPACSAARWGGDEFIVLVEGSITTGMSVAQLLDQRLRARYRLGDGPLSEVFAQASVGLSDWKPGEDAAAVIQRADQALKSRKRKTPVS
jgi:diguanylate cyclase (GGDEF)-like protein